MNIKNKIILMSSFILVFSLGVFLYVIAKEIQIEGKFLLDGSNLTIAPLNIPRYGTANPTTTVVGDLWYRSNNLYYNDQGTVRAVAHTDSWALISEAAILAGTETSSRFISAARLKYAFNNVATPTSSNNAANKSYVDTAVSGTTKGTVTSIATGTGLTGGTITSSGTLSVDTSWSDGRYVNKGSDDTILGKIIVGNTGYRRAGMYGIYDSYKIGHIWSMGTAYQIPQDGSNFGNLYGLAYKHTNNATGGTMAGGHQMVWVVNGTGTAALGTGIWTSGTGVFGGTVTVATPTGGSHATTKAYVDDLVGGVVVPGGRTSGDTGVGYLLYAGTTATAGRLDGGTTAPSGTTRLNYGGYLYATRLYDGGTRVAISTRSISTGSGLSGGGNLTADRTLSVDSTVIRTTGNQTLGGTKTFSSAVVLSTAGTLTTHAVRADRSISTGSGLSGGGNLTANRTLTVDSTVIRTTGDQTLGGTKTFSSPVVVPTPTGSTHATTKAYVDTAVTNAIAGLTVTLYDVASGTTGTAVCAAQNAICLDVVATDTNPSLSYSCLWTTTSSTLKARCLK